MKYKINKKLIFQNVDSELIIFDTDNSHLYTLNATAEFIFKKIKSGWQEEKILDVLENRYEVARISLRKDFKTIVNEMIKNKIITTVRT